MLKIEMTRKGIAAIGKRNLQRIGREAVYEAAEYWWAFYLPLHYKNTAYRRYHFAPRDKRTDQLKRDRKPWPFGEHNDVPALGEVVPHVFSGRSRERALARPNIKARAPNFETFQATVTIDAPAYNFSAGKRIDLRDEVTRSTPQEESRLQQTFAKAFRRGVVSHGGRRHIRYAAA